MQQSLTHSLTHANTVEMSESIWKKSTFEKLTFDVTNLIDIFPNLFDRQKSDVLEPK